MDWKGKPLKFECKLIKNLVQLGIKDIRRDFGAPATLEYVKIRTWGFLIYFRNNLYNLFRVSYWNIRISSQE
jgi:hypothetical protein